MPHPDWLDAITVDDVVTTLLVLAFLGGTAFIVFKFVHPLMVKVTQVLDLILGREDQQGIPGKPSMMQRFDTLDERMTAQDVRLEKIEGQVTPNHGSTNKLSEDVQELKSGFAVFNDDVRDVKAGLAALLKRFEDHLGH